MASQFSLPHFDGPALNGVTLNRRELLRRIALARETHGEQAARPALRYLLGELSYCSEPFRRPFRKLEVAQAASPQLVMLLPGLAAHPTRMRYLARQIERAGHTAKDWGLGINFGPTPENVATLEKRVQQLHDRYARKVVLIGWSLGGLFARELAHRQPDRIAKVITMGSPFSGDRRANNAWRIYQFITGHRVDCLPVKTSQTPKPPVETVAFWSPRDGVISARSARGLAHERDRAVALRCNHMGFPFAADSIQAALEELQRV